MADKLYAFEITLHRLAAEDSGKVASGATPSQENLYRDAWGEWPTLAVPHDTLAMPMAIGFDKALANLAGLERMYVEPDGLFVWTSPHPGLWWQVDGNAYEKTGQVLLVDLKGSCPSGHFDQLLDCFGWPSEQMTVQLVRAAVFLHVPTFRRHAALRGTAGDGEALRPR